MYLSVQLICIFKLIALITAQPNKLYIAGFFPTSTNIVQGSIGRGVLPSVYLALQHINNSPPMLRGYYLDLYWNDTKCDAAYGMNAFFDMLYKEPKKIILFGDACPSVTDPIAKASKFFNLVQLSYADTFTTISPNFFRIVPSEASFNPARIALLKYFKWTKVGTIYQNSPRYSLPHSNLLADLDKAKIEIAASQSLADELRPEMYFLKLQANDVRIILGNFGEEWARKIFCQAYKVGMFGRRYQWIISGLYDDQWWQRESLSLECTKNELLLSLNGYIATDILPLTSSQTTDFGISTYEYEAEYTRLRKGEYSRFHGYAYDGIWAIAFAIRNVDETLRSHNSPLTVKDFRYKDPLWAQRFKEALNQTNFNGVTGHVSFDKNERKGLVLIKQFQGENEYKIAEYHSSSDLLDFRGKSIYWRGSAIHPMDRSIEVISPSRINITLFAIISVFAIMGIIMAFVFLAMNIKYRNQRYIKMSSPYLNNLIIIGCILTYTSVILLGLDSGLTSESNFPYICASRAWVLMSGFTLAFGSMFSKTWRVHAIFTNIKLNKKLIKDYKLFMVVAILVFIDVATLTTWQIVDPFYRETSNGKPEPSPQNEDILVIPEMEFCQSKRMPYFLGSIYVYKGLLMSFGIFLAWETRHVSIPALNDSKYIGMSVYNVVIMCVIGAGLSFVLRDQQDAAFVIISIFIIFCSTATLCLVFVPKLIELRRNTQAGDRRVRATLKPFKKSRRDSDDMELHARIKNITEDNFRYRQRLKEKAYELEAITFRLRGLEDSFSAVKLQTPPVMVIDSFNLESNIENKELPCDSKLWQQYQCIKVTSLSTLTSKPIPNNPLYQQNIAQPDSCPELSDHKTDELLNWRSDRKLSATQSQSQIRSQIRSHSIHSQSHSQLESQLLSLRALSLIERVGSDGRNDKNGKNSSNRKISEHNSSNSSDSSSTRSISYKQSLIGEYGNDDMCHQINQNSNLVNTYEEYDDTSYAKAIKHSDNKYQFNGYSSCDDEESAIYEQNTVYNSERTEEYRGRRRRERRTRSLGVVGNEFGTLETNVDIETSLIALFPYLNGNNNQHLMRTGSSCPQVRCDIVEYL